MEFRSNLEAADWPLIDGITDDELEVWLFSSNSNRWKLLQWCLLQLDETLALTFKKNCDSIEKDVIEAAVSFGLCLSKEIDIVSGRASRRKQSVFWRRLFLLLPNAKSNVESPMKNISREAFESLVRSSDFWNLLASKVNLIPVDIKEPALNESVTELQDQLASAQNILQNLSNSVEDVESYCSSRASSANNDVSSSEQQEHFYEQMKEKMKACYDHLEKRVFPLVKPAPKDPLCEKFGMLIDLIADKTITVAQMLQGVQKMKVLTESILASPAQIDNLHQSEIQQYISSCVSIVSNITSLFECYEFTNSS